MAKRLDGKAIIVLGASDERSMGAAAARRFVAEGARVIVAARNFAKLEKVAESIGALAVACDITDEAQIEALAGRAVKEYGKLDGAVNFSGIDSAAPIAEVTRDALQQSVDVHFIGSILFIKHMAANMGGGGSIVITSTQTAILAPPGLAAYAGSKAGADQAVRIAAVEYGPQNIRVNSLSPGFTPSAMTAGYLEAPSVKEAFLKEIPLGRLPETTDLANAALWLVSDEAFITGQNIDISGGQTLRRIPTAQEMGF